MLGFVYWNTSLRPHTALLEYRRTQQQFMSLHCSLPLPRFLQVCLRHTVQLNLIVARSCLLLTLNN